MPRVLAFIEASAVTGRVRNLLATASWLDLHVATYSRCTAPRAHRDGIDALVAAARTAGAGVTVLEERHAFDPSVIVAARGALRRVRPDLVQTHNIKSHALIGLSREAIPWIAFHHGYTDTDRKVRIYNRLDRWSLRRAGTVVVPCAAFARELASAGVLAPEQVAVLHNAVEAAPLPDRRTSRQAFGVGAEHLIVSIGRLSREKGHDVLVDACAELPADLRDRTVVLIAGEGPERPRLQRRAAERGVRLCLRGFCADVAPCYAAADVVALPSRSEGSPNALLEAFAAGCAVVAARVGGVPEIAEDAISAFLVPPDNPRLMGAAIAKLLRSPDAAARLGANARCAASRFSVAARNSALRAIYARALDRASGPMRAAV